MIHCMMMILSYPKYLPRYAFLNPMILIPHHAFFILE
jgi:hypothetical protein